jgi:hypothetical protein
MELLHDIASFDPIGPLYRRTYLVRRGGDFGFKQSEDFYRCRELCRALLIRIMHIALMDRIQRGFGPARLDQVVF